MSQVFEGGAMTISQKGRKRSLEVWSKRGRGEGLWPRRQGNEPAVSLKNDNGPNRLQYANEVSAGWLALNGEARDWRAGRGGGAGRG